MDREKLHQLLVEQNQAIPLATQYVPRQIQPRLDELANQPFIVIIAGIRRCGKSTILAHLRMHRDSYYVNFDDERFIHFSVDDFQLMYEVLMELFGIKDTFIFDEIQNIVGWERFVRRLHDEGKKVFITGSNASMLSRELGTHLTGRHISLTLFPFSFKEFLVMRNTTCVLTQMSTRKRAEIKRLFSEYVIMGGFPDYLNTENNEYLKTLYENILYRDIISRYKLPNEKPLREIASFTASNVGKELSFNQLRKMTGLSSATTVREYFNYLENSFLCFLVPRYDASLKQQMYHAKKPYYIDTALLHLIGFRTSGDYGRILENVVYLALLRENKEVFFHRQKHECDFVIRQGQLIVEAIQVTKALTTNREREINGLIEAMTLYNLKTGLILTESDEDSVLIGNKQITVKPIWKWLLES